MSYAYSKFAATLFCELLKVDIFCESQILEVHVNMPLGKMKKNKSANYCRISMLSTCMTWQAWADDGSKMTHIFRNSEMIEFHNYICNHHGKCIQISTNMSSISSVIPEIDIKIQIFEECKITLLSKTNARILSVKLIALL